MTNRPRVRVLPTLAFLQLCAFAIVLPYDARVAFGFALAGVVLLVGDDVNRLTRRVAALEKRLDEREDEENDR